MSLSKSKCRCSNNCLYFARHAIQLFSNMIAIEITYFCTAVISDNHAMYSTFTCVNTPFDLLI